MEFFQAKQLNLDLATDEQLTDAWVSVGVYKHRMRQLTFDQTNPVPLRKLYPALRDANTLLDLIWDEILKRQINPWWTRKRHIDPACPPPHWERHFNFLRAPLPSVFE